MHIIRTYVHIFIIQIRNSYIYSLSSQTGRVQRAPPTTRLADMYQIPRKIF